MSRQRLDGKHLPPCVYQKHGAYYLVKAGKWTRIGETLDEALREYAVRFETPATGAMPELIWKVYQHKLPKLSKSTAASYKTSAKKLAAAFAEFSPSQVTMRHVAELKLGMASTPNMANETVSFLRIVFDYAIEHQLVDSNPCVGIKRLDVKKRRRCPTDVELKAVHAASGDRLKVIIELLCLTGQRVNDVLHIKRSQLVEQGIRFVQQKTGNPLLISWNPELRAAVERARQLHDNNVLAIYLLGGPRGAAPHYRVVIEQWHDACKRAGVEDLHMHDLRAYAVTSAKRQGLDPRAVAGHSSESMTARYIREHDEPVVTGPSCGVFQ